MKGITEFINEAWKIHPLGAGRNKNIPSLSSDLARKEKIFWDNMIDSQDYNNKTDELDIDSWKKNNDDILKKYKISDDDLEKILQYEIQMGLMSTEDEVMYKVII